MKWARSEHTTDKMYNTPNYTLLNSRIKQTFNRKMFSHCHLEIGLGGVPPRGYYGL